MGLSVKFVEKSGASDGPFTVATANGWRLFREWARPSKVLTTFANDGAYHDTRALSDALLHALADDPPDNEGVASTADQLLDVMGVGDPDETAVLTDDDGDDEEKEPVPFTELWLPGIEGFAEKWAPYTGPKGGKGWRNLATGEVLYQAEKPEEAAKQGRPQGSGLYGRGSSWAMKFRAMMFQMNQSPAHAKTEEWANQIRDKLAEAYRTSVKKRLQAIEHQIRERHGTSALDTPHYKTFLQATAPNRTPFEDEFKAIVHDMAAAAVEHSKGLASYADGMDRRRDLHDTLREHERKLSRAAAQHADALDKAHVKLVKALREHYADKPKEGDSGGK